MNRSEEAFLFSTFKEFCKCWRSGARARVIMESANGNTFVNFSAFLGNPDNVHFQPRPSKRNPTTAPRKKSEKKIKRDNDRAARFQEQKRNKQEGAASVSKPTDNPEAFATSTPGSESAMTLSSLESSLESRKFSFASPVPESLRQNTIDEASTSILLSDKKGELEQEENKSVDSLPQALTEEKVQDFSLPRDSQEEEIQDHGNEESLKTDKSDDSNDGDHDSDRTKAEEQDLAQEHIGKLFKLERSQDYGYVAKFFEEMGLKLSKRNFGHCMGRFDPRAAVNFGRLNKNELTLFNKEARVFILQEENKLSSTPVSNKKKKKRRS